LIYDFSKYETNANIVVTVILGITPNIEIILEDQKKIHGLTKQSAKPNVEG
jgi:hypothetical protein